MTLGHQKWDGESRLVHPTFKSGTESSLPYIGSAAPDSSCVKLLNFRRCIALVSLSEN